MKSEDKTKEINITNNHKIKFYKLIDKEYLLFIGINIFSFLVFLFFTFFVPQLIVLTLFMAFGTIVFTFGSWFYSARKKLRKVYYLNKANNKNFFGVKFGTRKKI